MKKILSGFLSLVMVFIFSVPAFATNPLTYTYLPVVENTKSNESPMPRIPNGIPIEVIAKVDGTGVKVKVAISVLTD